jgi:MacB-like periplasmic core domain/FtsX-like permease family
VSPEYFAVFGIRIVRGRPFTREEADENLPVVVVSERTASRFWPGQDPIGRTLDIQSNPKHSMRRPEFSRVQVIGMSEDVVSGTLTEGTDDTCVYFPASLRSPGELSMLIRARSDVPAVKRSIAEAVRAVQPEASFHVYVMRDMVGVQAWGFSVLGAVATLLAAIGLLLAFSGTYAVVGFVAAQRTRELGIRMALGATAQRIVGGMLAEALRTGAVGAAAGLVIAAVLVRASGAAIEMMPAFGPRPFVAGAVIVLAATVMAALPPSCRAARVDPSASLRAE